MFFVVEKVASTYSLGGTGFACMMESKIFVRFSTPVDFGSVG